MIQKELIDKIKPYIVLSVIIQLYSHIKILTKIT